MRESLESERTQSGLSNHPDHTMKSNLFSKKGNTAGFTSTGRPVAGYYSAKTKCWKVWTDEYARDTRNFGTAKEADTYARSLIDPVKTEELKWW